MSTTMYINNRLTTIMAAMVAVAGFNAAGQTLTKEITVDKEIVPEQRAATRLNATPALVQPRFTTPQLSMSDRTTPVTIPDKIYRLEPALAQNGDTAAVARRGYVDLGYFPTYNLAISAGYTFIDKADSRLNAWLQFDGLSYKSRVCDGDKLKFGRDNFVVGLDYAARLATGGRLSVDGAYSYMSASRPWNDQLNRLANHRAWIDAAYQGSTSQFTYEAGVNLGYTGMKGDSEIELADWRDATNLDAVNEVDFGLNGLVATHVDNNSRFGLRADARFNRFSHFACWSLDESAEGLTLDGDGARAIGVVKLNPFWQYGDSELKALIGVDVDLSVNSGRFFNLAPDVRVDWLPAAANSYFGVYLTARGGVHANTMGSLLDYSPYVDPALAYGNSRVPVDGEIGITIGPWLGTALELRAGYSMTDNWLMPVAVEGSNLWTRVDLKGWRAGATLTHRSKWVKELRVAYDYAPNKGTKGYYLWRDHASSVLDAQVTVNPIARLDVTAGFESRWGRKIYVPGAESLETGSLGRSNNLSVGALYRVTDRLSVFARGENLLDTHWYILQDIPAQGITGLVGVTYKF